MATSFILFTFSDISKLNENKWMWTFSQNLIEFTGKSLEWLISHQNICTNQHTFVEFIYQSLEKGSEMELRPLHGGFLMVLAVVDRAPYIQLANMWEQCPYLLAPHYRVVLLEMFQTYPKCFWLPPINEFSRLPIHPIVIEIKRANQKTSN